MRPNYKNWRVEITPLNYDAIAAVHVWVGDDVAFFVKYFLLLLKREGSLKSQLLYTVERFYLLSPSYRFPNKQLNVFQPWCVLS